MSWPFELGHSRGVQHNPNRTHCLHKEIAINGDVDVGDHVNGIAILAEVIPCSSAWVATFCHPAQPTTLFVYEDVPFSKNRLAKLTYHSARQEGQSPLCDVKVDNVAGSRMSGTGRLKPPVHKV